MPDIIRAGGFPFPHGLYQSGLDRIPGYILHDIKIFPLVFNDPGKKPFAPRRIRGCPKRKGQPPHLNAGGSTKYKNLIKFPYEQRKKRQDNV
jgi:hypothetical protein